MVLLRQACIALLDTPSVHTHLGIAVRTMFVNQHCANKSIQEYKTNKYEYEMTLRKSLKQKAGKLLLGFSLLELDICIFNI